MHGSRGRARRVASCFRKWSAVARADAFELGRALGRGRRKGTREHGERREKASRERSTRTNIRQMVSEKARRCAGTPPPENSGKGPAEPKRGARQDTVYLRCSFLDSSLNTINYQIPTQLRFVSELFCTVRETGRDTMTNKQLARCHREAF